MDKLISAAQQLGIHLSQTQIEQFETYYRELIAWNGKINLTSITDYEEVQTKHFLDSLTVISAFSSKHRERPPSTIDIGTGAGFPGIPLKIILPDISIMLLEATTKKTKFLEYLVTKLLLKDVDIVASRAEEIAHDTRYREKFDLVVSRAVASLPALVEFALPFCAIGGLFIAQKKGDITEEVAQSLKAITLLGGTLREVKSVELEELPDNRTLVIIDKIKSTPPTYPRRPGMPEKRPIVG
jgi:16S rRNA (guanine527-N7)-methyltransferase